MSNRLPSYRLHKPSGQAVVTLNGKDHYLGPHNSELSRSEYDRLISEWLANGRRLPQIDNPSVTIVEIIASYLEFAESYYQNDSGSTSEYTCMKDALRPLRRLYGETLIDEFGPLALKAVRQQMIDKGWCRTHINRQVNRVRRFFRWAIENELAKPELIQSLSAVAPLKRGRTEAKETAPIKPVPEEHVIAVLPHVSRQINAMIRLQQLTGMRPGEVVQIRPCEIDRSCKVWVYQPENHKTAYRGIQREIFLGPTAQRLLQPFLNRESDVYCFSPIEAEEERNEERRRNRKTPITPSQQKRTKSKNCRLNCKYDSNSYRRAIKYAISKANVPSWHPNQLRHSAATQLRAKFGLDVAQIILGHATAEITQVYAEVDRKKAISVVEIIG